MEIDSKTASLLSDSYIAAGLEQAARARNRNLSDKSSGDNATASGDTVSVSQDALLLTEAMRTAQNTPDVRAEKVEALRIQVANGTYQSDSRRIAESLIHEEPGLFEL